MPDVEIRHYHQSAMRIPFRDVDSWGLVWHGHYFSFVDHARLELLKRFEIPFGEFRRMGFLMPVVKVEMDLRAPGAADDPIVVEIAILRTRGAMIDTHFIISHADGKPRPNQTLARGMTRQVFVSTEGALLYHIPREVEAGFDALTNFARGASERAG